MVGPDGCGTVSPTSETLKVLSGAAQGSTPTANENFKFVGWYTDEACQTPVDSTWVDANNKIKPVKAEGAAWENGTTYYAKFEYNLTTLTITKQIDGTKEKDACFVFRVTGGDLINPLYVTINGNGSVKIEGLKVDSTYTVSEVYGNWRYTSQTSQQRLTLVADSRQNTVTFTNTHSKNQWLDDNAYNENTFRVVSGN